MAIDHGPPLDPDVRLSAELRGPWQPIGPPVRRLVAAEEEQEAVLGWFGELSGGGRPTPVTDPGGDARADDGFVDVQAQQDHLTSLHRAEITTSTPPTIPDVMPREVPHARPDEARPLTGPRQLLRDVTTWLQGHTPFAAAGMGFLEDVSRRGLQSHADTWWQRLSDNDQETVRHRLEQAFGTAGFGAAVVGVHGDAVGVVLGSAPPEVLVGRWQRLPDAERATRIPRPERHRLHATIIGSALVALAAEALAVAPGLNEVRCAALQAEHPERRPAVLALAAFSREQVLSRATRERLVDQLRSGHPGDRSTFRMDPVGSTGVLAPLDRDLPAVRRLLDAIEV